ncbi:hypothetical protein IFM89_006127 [Coptis chinensis]|uniref:Alpha/beta hydrolase fold-3 domain-containing protein n=1 Tax=Coptis chinensis TaxID=261450 RepID=A0A835LA86_9MAGN|nr:hypothetical protein IFM89_006127 [Coptis chinensis]
MASTVADDVVFEYPPFIRVYKDGRQERLREDVFVAASVDPSTGVSSKDVVIQPETGLSARMYLPKRANPATKLPLVIYFHGGGFCIESAFCPTYHNYLNLLVSKANVVAVSVDYRRAPEHPLPVAYEDSWTALKWVFSHPDEEWLTKYADYNRVYMAGDSAGGNISHNMAVRAHIEPNNFKFKGIVLAHPYFIGSTPLASEGDMDLLGKLWLAVYPTTSGLDDPLVNPLKDPNFSKVACKRVLVCVAGLDVLVHRGKHYHENLGKCGWEGVLEFTETEAEPHVFHVSTPEVASAGKLMERVVAFLNAP